MGTRLNVGNLPFDSAEDAITQATEADARAALDGTSPDGRTPRVSEAQERAPREDGGSGNRHNR